MCLSRLFEMHEREHVPFCTLKPGIFRSVCGLERCLLGCFLSCISEISNLTSDLSCFPSITTDSLEPWAQVDGEKVSSHPRQMHTQLTHAWRKREFAFFAAFTKIYQNSKLSATCRWTEVCVPQIKYSCEQMFQTDSLKKLISPHQRKAVSLETRVIYVPTLVWALKFEISPDSKTVSFFSGFIIFVRFWRLQTLRKLKVQVLSYAIFDPVKTPYEIWRRCGAEAPPTTTPEPVF